MSAKPSSETIASRFGEIAFHYAAGSDVGDAATVVRTALDAGDDALQRLAFDEAAHNFRTALAATERTAADVELRDRVLRGLGTALNAMAHLDEAKPLWLQVADLARQAGDPERLFTAIAGYLYVIQIDDDTKLLRLLDELLDLLGPGDSPLRACALGWRAMPGGAVGAAAMPKARHARQPHGDARMVNEAVEMARRTGSDLAVARTLRSRMLVAAEGQDAHGMLRDAEEYLALVGELLGEVETTTGVDSGAAWRDVSCALLRLGRRAEAERRVEMAIERAEQSGVRLAVNGALILKAALATASGRFADGKRLAAEAAEDVGQNTALVQLGYTAQILAARMEQGRLSEVITTLRQLDSLDIAVPEWRAMFVGALADAGNHAEASEELHKLLDDPLTGFPAQASSLAIRHLTEACRLLGDSDRANAFLSHVEPWAGQILVVPVCTSIEGASDRALGHLLATLGRLDEADDGIYGSGRAGTLRRIPTARRPNPLLARSSAPRTQCGRRPRQCPGTARRRHQRHRTPRHVPPRTSSDRGTRLTPAAKLHRRALEARETPGAVAAESSRARAG